MYRHYLTMTLRTLARHKLYTFINIAGLSIALTCAILIALFVRDEASYDAWIPGTDDLYRAEITFKPAGHDPLLRAQIPFPTIAAMKDEIPEIRVAAIVLPEKMTVILDDKPFPETVSVVSPTFLQTIPLPLEKGDAATALAQPESIVLSAAMARKYFGDAEPMGKVLRLSATDGGACDPADERCLSAVHPVTVTGVLREPPADSHVLADLLLPNTSQADQIPMRLKQEGWYGTQGGFGYVALAPGTDPGVVVEKTRAIMDRYVHPEKFGRKARGSEAQEVRLTPFRDVHLTSDNFGGMKPAGSRTTVYGFAAIAVLIVLLACFNFMNLATARATLRALEIGLRKVVGAKRRQLIVQFMTEATLVALISLVIAIALLEIVTPAYGNLLDRPLGLHGLRDWKLLLLITGGAIAAGLLSGLYPALVLSSFRPVAVLKMSTTSTQSGSGLLRSVLVVAQFAVSIGLGIATLVVFRQIEFARQTDLGFRGDGVVVVQGVTKITPNAREALVRALSGSEHIAGASLSNAVPFFSLGVGNVPIGIEGETQEVNAHIYNISPDFPSVYELPVLAGRSFSRDYSEDVLPDKPSANVLLNADAVRRFGLMPDAAVGRTVTIFKHPLKVVGVLGDTLFDGVRTPVQPVLYVHDPASDQNTLLSVRLRAGHQAEGLAFLDKTWAAFAPGTPIQRQFVTDSFDALFDADRRQGTMFGIFVAIAIFIACLGLFGLAVFTAARRTREIGVRKVFGARVSHLMRLLLWEISLPVLIANLLAWPVAYYYLSEWLEGYAYRIFLSPLYFIGAGAVALLVACATVFSHTRRLARASPVQALRYE